MANKSISQLTSSAANLANTDVMPVVQTAGVGPVKMTGTQLKAGVLASPTITGHPTIEGVTSTGATGTGKLVFDTSPTLVTPALGTPASGNFSTGTFTWPTFNQNTSGTAAGLSSTLAVTSGGTGTSTAFTAGSVIFAGASGVYSQNTSYFVWDNTNVWLGIGTATPTTRLHIKTSGVAAKFESNGDVTTTGVNYYDFSDVNGSCAYWGYGGDGSGVMSIWNRKNGALLFATNNSQRMSLDANGYLLIGYTSSNGAYKLQVNSQIFATNSTIATSDARYKTNVSPIAGALDMVKALNPVTFNWKAHPIHDFDTAIPVTGFLAQEVQTALADKPFVNSLIKESECVLEPAVYENVVIEPEVKEVRDEFGNIITEAKPAIVERVLTKDAVTESFLGIAEGNMIAILTAAIKELKAEFDAYKASHP